MIIVHLDPNNRSDLAPLIARHTQMPVSQVTSPLKLEANHIYVIPPDRRLQISRGEIVGLEFNEARGQRAPIDSFFRSLAEEHGDGFAVILSGAGADGAVGIRAVKETGGIILVQDPNEAEYPSMPRNAISTGIADFVLPIGDLALRLAEMIHDKHAAAMNELPALQEDVLRRVLGHVRVRTGHDFSKYKRATVLRRIARRLQVARIENPNEYYDYLRDTPEEAQALFGDLLISVTTFFRDSEAFDVLTKDVLPQLYQTKQAGDSVRVWVPGCATGEEAYSISILLSEEAARQQKRLPIQVFGSDLDARSLAVAREGRYPAAIEADVSEERLRRYFQREGDQYHVRQELRDTVLFASHSLLKDPPFSRIDLISCRNLLIYLDRELQQQVCSTFHYALNPEGFLFLGSSETADNPPGLFRIVDRKARIYQTTVRLGEKPRLLPRLLGTMSVLREQASPTARHPAPRTLLTEAAAHRHAIERLAPPSILVDSMHRVIHLSENAGRYLQPSGGPLSGDMVDLVRPELRFELQSALHRVFEHSEPILSLPIPVRFNGEAHRVLIQVKPIREDQEGQDQSALVLFIEGEAIESAAQEMSTSGGAVSDVVRRLTDELQLTQTRLRTTREESEAATEELRAANEELQSINEEYRSTSEELETSKEELQSINEELQTVNSELKLKLEAVSRAHSDLQNLMAATEFGTLFLDTSLRIKRFTQPVTELFSITPSDEGRPLADFAHRLDYDDLIKDAQAILSNLTPIRHEIRSRTGHWYDVRLRPYRTVDDKIDGVVVTFVDITERRNVEEALRESEQMLWQEKHLVDLARDPIFIWDFDGGILEWNRGSEELYGYSRHEAVGKTKEHLLRTTVPGSSFAELRTKLAENGSWSGELKQKTKAGRDLTVESRILLETMGTRRLALESTRDITERKIWEQRQRLLLGELTHRVKNTLAVVQSITRQTLRSSISAEDFAERLDGRLAALASAHSLLVESEWHGADLGALAREQLQPYISENSDRLSIRGDVVSLPPDLATPFGLVLHELATNAVKFGSLSQPGGRVELSWYVHGNDQCILTVVWQEKGGPPVGTPTRAGFGGTLIDRGLRGATVVREFRHDGLECNIHLPLEAKAGRDAGESEH